MNRLILATLVASTAFVGTPASAALTFVRACAATDITLPGGASFTSCTGYYDGNIFNNSSNADIQAALTALGAPAGIFTTFAAIPAANKLSGLGGATIINFGQTLIGDTIVGVHFGAGNGSPGFGQGPGGKNVDTSGLYRFNAGAGISSFTLNYQASSNAVLFQTQAVPEPMTWAMMLGGFGMLGFAARRRTRTAIAHA